MHIVDTANNWVEENGNDQSPVVKDACGIIKKLTAELKLYEALLNVEQEDCRRQRTNKNAEWERAERLLHVVDLADSCLDIQDIPSKGAMHCRIKEVLGRLPKQNAAQTTEGGRV